MKARTQPLARAISGVVAGLGLGAFANPAAAALPLDTQIDMKLLVVGSTDDPATPVNEQTNLDAITAILDRVGIPYQLVTYKAGTSWTTAPLPALDDGLSHAYFQGVIFANSDPRMNPYTGWGGDDATRLANFAYKFGIRVASPYVWTLDTGCLREPGASEGVSVGATPVSAFLTAAGRTALPYLKAGTTSAFPLPLKYTYYYPARALPATGTGTPGLQVMPPNTTVTTWLNANTVPVAAVCRFSVGDTPPQGSGITAGATREILAFTVSHAPYLNHTLALSYGVVHWVTKGIHLGEKQVWLDAEVDDIFLPDDEYPYTILDDGKWYRFQDYTRQLLGGPVAQPINEEGTCGVTQDPATGAPCEYRLIANDLVNVKAWQDKVRANAWGTTRTINGKSINTTNNGGADYTEGFRLNMVYNGVLADLTKVGSATQPCGSLCDLAWPNDDLTKAVYDHSQYFKWINHTWNHENMNNMNFEAQVEAEGACPNNVLDAYTQLCWNHAIQPVLKFADYAKGTLVTPEISGLYNRDVLEAMGMFGIETLVSDTSKPTPPPGASGCPEKNVNPATGETVNWPLPAPNAGKYNCTALTSTPTRTTLRYIYEVPRLPNSLFYMVTTATEWTNAYNFFYGKSGVLASPPVWPYVDATGARRNLTYPQVIDVVSEQLLGYLLSYDIRPWMFHSANLRKYTGTRFLLGDLLEETLTKYNAYYQNQPIRSPNLKEIGDRMKQRMVYNAMKVQGVLMPGQSQISLVATGNPNELTRPTDGTAVTVPVTGVAVGANPGTRLGSNPMTYGSGAAAQTISYVTLKAGDKTPYFSQLTAPVNW